MDYMYSSVFIGGTFDGLHQGHTALLDVAFRTGTTVIIGITSDKFVKEFKLNPQTIAPLSARREVLESWLKTNNYTDRAEIIVIEDPLEPAASMKWDAIVASEESRDRATQINERRKSRNLKPLMIIEVGMVNAEDGRPISSTRVRQGEIDALGHIVMPDALRPILQKPLGRVLTNGEVVDAIKKHAHDIIVAVGDITASKIVELGIIPDLSVIDLSVRRQPFPTLRVFTDKPDLHLMCVKSGPGNISHQATEAIRGAFSRRDHTVIVVDGEEDLLALPAIAHAPVGAVIYYGQPPIPGNTQSEGLVEVIVTEAKKQEIQELLKQFI